MFFGTQGISAFLFFVTFFFVLNATFLFIDARDPIERDSRSKNHFGAAVFAFLYVISFGSNMFLVNEISSTAPVIVGGGLFLSHVFGCVGCFLSSRRKYWSALLCTMAWLVFFVGTVYVTKF